MDFTEIIKPTATNNVTLANNKLKAALNDEMLSLSKAFKCLCKMLKLIHGVLTAKAEKSTKFRFNAELAQLILNQTNLKALVETFILVDAMRINWTPNAILTAFWRAIGVQNTPTVSKQLDTFVKNFDKNFDKLNSGKLSMLGFNQWIDRNEDAIKAYDTDKLPLELFAKFKPTIDYSKMTKVVLSAMCKDANLTYTGTKAQLIERLVTYDSQLIVNEVAETIDNEKEF